MVTRGQSDCPGQSKSQGTVLRRPARFPRLFSLAEVQLSWGDPLLGDGEAWTPHWREVCVGRKLLVRCWLVNTETPRPLSLDWGRGLESLPSAHRAAVTVEMGAGSRSPRDIVLEG